jgi:hypothetical protein
MLADPLLGATNPVSIFIVVDFPAPFGPRKPRTSPAEHSKLKLSTTVCWPYLFVRPSIFIMILIAKSGYGARAAARFIKIR